MFSFFKVLLIQINRGHCRLLLPPASGHHVFPFTFHGSIAMRRPRAWAAHKMSGIWASFRQSPMRCNYFNLKSYTSLLTQMNKIKFLSRARGTLKIGLQLDPRQLAKICKPVPRTCLRIFAAIITIMHLWLYELLTGLTYTL